MIIRRDKLNFNEMVYAYILRGYNDGQPVKIRKTRLEIELETAEIIAENWTAFEEAFNILGTTGAISFVKIFELLGENLTDAAKKRMEGFYITVWNKLPNDQKAENRTFSNIYDQIKDFFTAVRLGVFDDILDPTYGVKDDEEAKPSEDEQKLIFGTDGSAYGEESIGSDI